jgi:hypothetical protein
MTFCDSLRHIMTRWHWNIGGSSIWSLYELPPSQSELKIRQQVAEEMPLPQAVPLGSPELTRWLIKTQARIDELLAREVRTPLSEEMIDAGLWKDAVHPDWKDVPPPTTTLAQVVAELGLVPFSTRREEEDVRFALGDVIGAGMKTWELVKGGNVQIAEVQKILRRIAKILTAALAGSANADELQAVEQTLQGAETGFRHPFDTGIALLIANTLAREIGEDKARDRVLNFRKWLHTVAAACRKAAEDLDKINGKDGHPSLGWYRDFQRILTCIAEKNSIRPKVEIDRVTGEPRGRFIELAERFEELLPPMLRSRTRVAIAKRLQRSEDER